MNRNTPAKLMIPALLVLYGPDPKVTLVNGDFEADGGPFGIPTGWVPFGDGVFEGHWDQNWKGQVGDPFPLHSVGLYQVIPDAVPGTRYRLTAEAGGGGPEVPVRIGLATGDAGHLETITWSRDHTETGWASLSVDAEAGRPGLVVLLEQRNLNPQYPSLQRGRWDNVRVAPLHVGAPPEPPGPAAPVIPPPHDVYAGLANLWSLAWPKPGVRTFLASSRDPDPNGNADYNHAEGIVAEEDGTWTVLKSFTGPGAILRIWMTGIEKTGRIRIYVDGGRAVDQKLVDFLGSPGLFTWPLANKTSGGWMSYVPIPFAASARVQVKDAAGPKFYWQITHQSFAAAPGLRPFTDPLNTEDAAHLRRIQSQWTAATLNPKPEWPGTREAEGSVAVTADGSVPLWSATGAGLVDSIHIALPAGQEGLLQELRLRAFWDGAGSPQVDAPLGLFFGVGYVSRISRGLLIGTAPPDGGYSYFPMPFRNGARIELANATGTPVGPVRFKIRWVPVEAEAVSPLRFHTSFRHDTRAGEGRLYFPLEVDGAGHLVGLSATMGKGNVDDVHFLEGDETIRVDGEGEPSTAGTGTEDYFTCGWYFSGGPISLAPVGAPEVNRELKRVAAYRLHVPDCVPFESSLRFGFEVGDAPSSSEYGDYATVAYYYLRTGSP